METIDEFYDRIYVVGPRCYEALKVFVWTSKESKIKHTKGLMPKAKIETWDKETFLNYVKWLKE